MWQLFLEPAVPSPLPTQEAKTTFPKYKPSHVTLLVYSPLTPGGSPNSTVLYTRSLMTWVPLPHYFSPFLFLPLLPITHTSFEARQPRVKSALCLLLTGCHWQISFSLSLRFFIWTNGDHNQTCFLEVWGLNKITCQTFSTSPSCATHSTHSLRTDPMLSCFRPLKRYAYWLN